VRPDLEAQVIDRLTLARPITLDLALDGEEAWLPGSGKEESPRRQTARPGCSLPTATFF